MGVNARSSAAVWSKMRGWVWLAEDAKTAAPDVAWLRMPGSGSQFTGRLSMQTSSGNGNGNG